MSYSTPPPRAILPVLQKLKSAYLLWYGYYQKLPKTHRYTLGQKVDNTFTDIIEAVAAASFLARDEKIPFVRRAIQKLDTLKIFLLVLWEAKSLDNKKYAALSAPLDEIGRQLGGWNGQLTKQKQNSPSNKGEK